MKEITVKAYEFDELSDSAKEKARDWFRGGHFDDNFWSECTIDEAVQQGELMGISFKPRNQKWRSSDGKREGVDMSPCIFWSGFSSQGDGACFEGTWRASDVKADKVADGWGEDPATTEIKRIAAEFDSFAKQYPESSFTVRHSGHYSHKYCTQFDVSLGEALDDLEGITQEEWSKAEGGIAEIARDFMDWIYRQLEKEWEYRHSDECVDEDIRANGYLFTEYGSRSTVL